MIELRNIKKSYFDKNVETFALKIDYLHIKKGEYVALIGPDGAGKSTLIKIICGITPFDSGELAISKYLLPRDFDKARLLIGYLSQTFTLYKNLTVYENIDYFASLFDVKDKREKIEDILKAVGLYQFRERLSKDLSGGMKQKLSIACALIRSPEVLILDEPTTGVDPRSRRDIFKIIEEKVKEGLTVIFSSSYMDEAERADRVIMLNRGEIIGDYKTEDILKRYTFISHKAEEEGYKGNNKIVVFSKDEDKNEYIKRLSEQNIKYDVIEPSIELLYISRLVK